MKFCRAIGALCVGAMILSALGGCVGEDGSKERDFTANEENVKLLGRTYFEDGTLYLAHSGTGLEFSFKGSECEFELIGDASSNSSSQEDDQARIGVFVNGERVIDQMLTQKETSVTVQTDPDEESVISLVKLSEAANSVCAVKSIKVFGSEISPTADKDMLIEFVGDSITCGYGVDDPDKSHHFSTTTEDVTKAYAYKTAQTLDADYSMISLSGYGIISGYSNDGQKVSAQTIPQYYDKIGFTWNGGIDFFAPAYIEWDFSRQADVVVINLGTNDDSYIKGDLEKTAEFIDEYAKFIKQVREKNPDAKIICAFGIMGDGLYSAEETAVQNYRSETGDENVFALKFDVQQSSDGYGADWHPSEATHEKAAQKLSEEIKTIFG